MLVHLLYLHHSRIQKPKTKTSLFFFFLFVHWLQLCFIEVGTEGEQMIGVHKDARVPSSVWNDWWEFAFVSTRCLNVFEE